MWNIAMESSAHICDQKKIKLLNKGERFLHEKKLMNPDGELTSDGQKAFLQFLFDSDIDLRDGFIDYIKVLFEDEDGE